MQVLTSLILVLQFRLDFRPCNCSTLCFKLKKKIYIDFFFFIGKTLFVKAEQLKAISCEPCFIKNIWSLLRSTKTMPKNQHSQFAFMWNSYILHAQPLLWQNTWRLWKSVLCEESHWHGVLYIAEGADMTDHVSFLFCLSLWWLSFSFVCPWAVFWMPCFDLNHKWAVTTTLKCKENSYVFMTGSWYVHFVLLYGPLMLFHVWIIMYQNYHVKFFILFRDFCDWWISEIHLSSFISVNLYNHHPYVDFLQWALSCLFHSLWRRIRTILARPTSKSQKSLNWTKKWTW